MRYVLQNTGQQVEVPMLPGLTLRGDQWYGRASTPAGFKKTQILGREWKSQQSPRAASATGSPRVSKLMGAAASPDSNLMTQWSPARPDDPASSRSAVSRRPATSMTSSSGRSPRKFQILGSPPGTARSEASEAFGIEAVAPMERSGVLRFAAYVVESTEWVFSGELGVPAHEGTQVRKCFVLFHLEDATVEILEERTPNSGVAGGQFYARAPPAAAGMGWRPVPSGGGRPSRGSASSPPFGPDLLQVGGKLYFLGLVFHLVDADGFTRDWFSQNLGVQQPECLPYPSAAPAEYHAEHATGLGQAQNGVAYGKFGGQEVFRKSPEAHARHEQMSKERAFFRDANGECLKFLVTWEDHSPGGQTHEYTLIFYLSDGCAEICTTPKPGFDHFPHLLKRQKLPLNWDETVAYARSHSGPVEGIKAPQYATPRDLLIGNTLTVLNRELRIVDCSEQTRRWYARELGVRLRRLEGVPSKRRDEFAGTDHGAGTSSAPWGQAFSQSAGAEYQSPRAPDEFAHLPQPASDSSDDSKGDAVFSSTFGRANERGYKMTTLNSGKATPDRDWERDVKVADRTIRCRLELHDVRDVDGANAAAAKQRRPAHAPAELGRAFVLTYYLPDDTLAIFEEHKANSGVLGGPFLKRGTYKTRPPGEHASRYFKPSDFYLGAIVHVSQHNVMKVTDLDNASLKTMMDLPREFPFCDLSRVLPKLNRACAETPKLQDALARTPNAAHLQDHLRDRTHLNAMECRLLCVYFAAKDDPKRVDLDALQRALRTYDDR